MYTCTVLTMQLQYMCIRIICCCMSLMQDRELHGAVNPAGLIMRCTVYYISKRSPHV